MVTEATVAGRLDTDADRRAFRSMAYARISVAVQRATVVAAVDGAVRIKEDLLKAARARSSLCSPPRAQASSAHAHTV